MRAGGQPKSRESCRAATGDDLCGTTNSPTTVGWTK